MCSVVVKENTGNHLEYWLYTTIAPAKNQPTGERPLRFLAATELIFSVFLRCLRIMTIFKKTGL